MEDSVRKLFVRVAPCQVSRGFALQINRLGKASVFHEEAKEAFDMHAEKGKVPVAFSLLMVSYHDLRGIPDSVTMDMHLGADIDILEIEEKSLIKAYWIGEKAKFKEHGTRIGPLRIEALSQVPVQIKVFSAIDVGILSHEPNPRLEEGFPCIEAAAYGYGS